MNINKDMNKLTMNKDNHYIQAAWIGQFWGYSEHPNPKKKRSRDNKVWVLKIGEILRDKEINHWPTIEELINRGYITKEHSAEKIFLSGYHLLDDIDIDFADKCESFLPAIGAIKTKIIENYTQNKEKNLLSFDASKLFTLEERKEVLNKLKSYICLNLSRTKLSVVYSYQKVENAIINRSNKGFIIEVNSEEEQEKVKKYMNIIKDSELIELKKIIAYFDIKNTFEFYLNEIKQFNNINFRFAWSISKDYAIDNNFITEIPFISGKFLKPEQRNTYIERFLKNIKENDDFYKKISLEYGKCYENNLEFKKNVEDIFNNFIAGVLTPEMQIILLKEKNTLSNIFTIWLMDYPFNVYKSIAIQNNIENIVCKSQSSIELSYAYLSQNMDIKYFKELSIKVNDILNNKKSLNYLLKNYSQNQKYYEIIKTTYKLITKMN